MVSARGFARHTGHLSDHDPFAGAVFVSPASSPPQLLQYLPSSSKPQAGHRMPHHLTPHLRRRCPGIQSIEDLPP
ncbi:protein of unknown function [Methanoculleus bourgensis]|uniref:Uncharacterized protein n=1 Tax=Methanoculleus bourgensis TaxID=83986 RepID=A0A0X3BHU7_9EURY|nr:protein of unknown function [Methanoculleus bourgensis]